MRPPCEQVVIRDYLPLLRNKVVNLLFDKGLNQVQIAEKLGISQPRVSQYLSKNNTMKNNLSEYRTNFVELVSDVALLVTKELDKGKSQAEILPIVCYNCKKMRNSGPICRIHFEYDYPFSDYFKNSPKNCSVCHTTEDLNKEFGKRKELLNSLEYLLSQIEVSNVLLPFIPEIGAQIVLQNREEILSKENIAGIPGRIRKIKNRLHIDAKPEFGASNLLAQILIDICKKNNSIYLLALALKTSEKLTQLLEKKESHIIRTEDFDNKYNYLINILSYDSSKQTLSIIDRGSVGFEPITYIFYRDVDNFLKFWNIDDFRIE